MELASTLPQIAVALLALIGLMLLLAVAAKRWPLKRDPEPSLRVVSSISIGSREKLIVVSFEQQRLLLGVTSQSINALCVTAPSEPETESVPQPLRLVEERE